MTFSNTLTHTTPLLSDYWYSPWKCMPFALACRVRFLNQLSVQSGGLDIILHKTASTSDWGGGGGGGVDDDRGVTARVNGGWAL